MEIVMTAEANSTEGLKHMINSKRLLFWIGDVQDCQGVSASEMTYIVSSGALNSTHSFTHSKHPTYAQDYGERHTRI